MFEETFWERTDDPIVEDEYKEDCHILLLDLEMPTLLDTMILLDVWSLGLYRQTNPYMVRDLCRRLPGLLEHDVIEAIMQIDSLVKHLYGISHNEDVFEYYLDVRPQLLAELDAHGYIPKSPSLREIIYKGWLG